MSKAGKIDSLLKSLLGLAVEHLGHALPEGGSFLFHYLSPKFPFLYPDLNDLLSPWSEYSDTKELCKYVSTRPFPVTGRGMRLESDTHGQVVSWSF